jgi:hypothetical protein
MTKAKTTKAKKNPDGVLPFSEGLSASSLPATQLDAVPTEVSKDPCEAWYAVVHPTPERVRTAFPWGWKARDKALVESSWRRQAAIIRTTGNVVRIQACLDEPGYGSVSGNQCPGRRDVAPRTFLDSDLIIMGSVPGPAPSRVSDATKSLARLREALRLDGVDALPVKLLDRSHTWTEPGLIAVGWIGDPIAPPSWQDRALECARQFGLDHAVRVMNGRWQVLNLTLPRAKIQSEDRCSVTRDDLHRCPILGTAEARERCASPGGSGRGAASQAWVAWVQHRDDLIDVLGCDICRGGGVKCSRRRSRAGSRLNMVGTLRPTRWLAADDTRFTGVESMNE